MSPLRLLLTLFMSTLLSFSQEIKVGMSADFSGSIQYIGNDYKIGIETYFKHINNQSKYTFTLIAKDDTYEPLKASNNVKEFIQDQDIIALIGNVGTPTANVIMPMLNRNELILFGAYTGGDVLRKVESMSFNYRVSYSQEAYFITKNLLLKGLSTKDIVVFSQNDTYGDAGFFGVKKALNEYDAYNARFVTHVRYPRGTSNVEYALSHLYDMETTPKAVIMVSTAKQAVKFVSMAKQDFPKLKFFHLSPVNIDSIKSKIAPYIDDFYVTQVVPNLDSRLSIIKEYKGLLEKYYPKQKANLISLEGFIVAKLFVTAIEQANMDEVNRNNVYNVFKNMKALDIGLGFSSNFNNSRKEYSSQVWLTGIKNEKVSSIRWDSVKIGE